ncbi:hypothetical protein QVD17_16642 [Tagetes erecta]|uniref:Uncharacterized protein n=1 Tax=Tagetes erecta TaxID=13708 RepID=A0AAD8KR69_TARER|nr:hypothetical protein QVD17_16642 [Tagetes erecta]
MSINNIADKVRNIDGKIILKSCLKNPKDGVDREAAEIGVEDPLKGIDGSHAKVANGVSHANPNIHPSTTAEPITSVGVGSYAAKLTEGIKKHVNFRLLESKSTMENIDVVSLVPSKTDSEGFQEVKRKDKASYKHGFHVGKQKKKVEYRPVNRVESVSKSMKGSQDKMEGKLDKLNIGDGVVMNNRFRCLQTTEVGETSNTFKGGVEEESDVEEVYNETELFMKDKVGVSTNLSEGASTPGSLVSND